MDKQQPQPISWKRLSLFAALFVGLTLAGFFTVFEHFSGRNLSFDGQLLKPGFVGACLLLLVIYFAADGLRFYYTLVALGVRVKPRVMAKLVFINIFFSNITPMATGGGFAQVWYLHQQGVSVGKAMAASTIRTVLAVLFIFSLAPWFLLTQTSVTSVGSRSDALHAVLILLWISARLAATSVLSDDRS